MEAKYTLTEDDIANALKLQMKMGRNSSLFLGAIFVYFVGSMFYTMPDTSVAYIIFVILASTLCFAVFGFLMRLPFIFIAKRNFRKHFSNLGKMSIKLTDDGVDISSDEHDQYLKWDKIHKWRQNDSHILIYRMPHVTSIIPKSIEKDGFDIKKLTDSLQAHVGPAEQNFL